MTDITVSNNLHPDPNGSFRIGQVMGGARQLIKGSKGAYFLAMLFFVVVIGIPMGVLATIFAGTEPRSATLLNLVGLAIASPFVGGFIAMSLHRAAGRDISAKMLFRYHRLWLPIIITTGIASIVSWIFQLLLGQLWGPLLSLIPSLFLYYSSYFIVDRGQNALRAIQSSVAFVGRNFWPVLGLYLLVSLISILLGAITLGIGLIWLVPWACIAQAMAYAHAEGIHLEPL